MPFGAVSFVHAFLRTASAMNHLSNSLLHVPMTSYFDDFTVVTRPTLEKGATIAVETLFRLIGLAFSESPKKNRPFAQVFEVLGVSFDLMKCPEGCFVIRNTRVHDLSQQIDSILAAGQLNGATARSLRGRLNFAEGQLYGRTAAAVLKDLGRYEHVGHLVKTSETTRTLLTFMLELIKTGLPRTIFCNDPGVFHIFTDGAIEGMNGTDTITSVGAVLVDNRGRVLTAFGMTIDQQMAEVLGARIHQFEILPVVLACIAFEEEIRSQAVLFHIDNAAAQSALINAGSSNRLSRSLIFIYVWTEAATNRQQTWWFIRTLRCSGEGWECGDAGED